MVGIFFVSLVVQVQGVGVRGRYTGPLSVSGAGNRFLILSSAWSNQHKISILIVTTPTLLMSAGLNSSVVSAMIVAQILKYRHQWLHIFSKPAV